MQTQHMDTNGNEHLKTGRLSGDTPNLCTMEGRPEGVVSMSASSVYKYTHTCIDMVAPNVSQNTLLTS